MKEDELLYKDFLKGDKHSFDLIVKKYREELISFIQKYVRDKEIAEDLSQDTFVYVLVNRTEYDFKYSLRTYLYTIARCRAINYLNKKKREVNMEEEEIENIQGDFKIEDNIIKEENKKEILEAIYKLKEEYKTIIILKDFEDFSYKEICKILDKSMPQVKVLLHRARKALEKNIKKEEFIC